MNDLYEIHPDQHATLIDMGFTRREDLHFDCYQVGDVWLFFDSRYWRWIARSPELEHDITGTNPVALAGQLLEIANHD